MKKNRIKYNVPDFQSIDLPDITDHSVKNDYDSIVRDDGNQIEINKQVNEILEIIEKARLKRERKRKLTC